MATVTLSNTTVLEHPQIGTIVGYLGVTGDGATQNPTFRVIDPGSGRFEIKPISEEGILNWVLVVKNNVNRDGSSLFDFENDALNKFNFKIAILGDFGEVISTTPVTISVTDNTAPTEIILSNNYVVEHAQKGTYIGDIWALDPDDGETLTYTLTDDAGGRFALVDGALVVKDGSLLDDQAASFHQITVEVKDSEGNVYAQSLTINVTDAVDVRKGIVTNDRPVESAGADHIKDLSGNDDLVGTVGADVINGDAGNDKISGLGGDDIINGGLGKDQLAGGTGKDTFVFDAAVRKGAFDQVTDFNSADDTLQFNLSALKSFKVKAFNEGKLSKKFFTVGTEAKDKNDFVYYDKKKGFVYLDADGSGAMKGVQILKLKPGTAMSADDFLFV